MNTICLLACRAREIYPAGLTKTGGYWYHTVAVGYTPNSLIRWSLLNWENLTRPEIIYGDWSYNPNGDFYEAKRTNAVPELTAGDKIRISYLYAPGIIRNEDTPLPYNWYSGVTLEYLPQNFSFNLQKKEFKQDLADSSVFISGMTTLRMLNISGDNMTKKCFDEMVELLKEDYCYVHGLEEGGFMGRFSFNASRVRGQTEIYSYNISIEEVGKI